MNAQNRTRPGPLGQLDREVVERLRSVDLCAWFDTNGRDLPWRDHRDPWTILVAEVMLQQTQVARVIEPWTRFLASFPTVADCAAAPQARLVEHWAGLGFNRRARNLHRCAQMVMAEHGGEIPRERGALLGLPGIGTYTARAVRVFAFEEVDAVLDTNVARILARVGGRTLTRGQAQALADESVDLDDPWRYNQALLDVGARHCRAAPDCDQCPLGGVCDWAQAGHPEPDPARGSGGVSGTQSRFEGSDRQGRGRLITALRTSEVPVGELADVMGWPHDEPRAQRVACSLVDEGMVVLVDDRSQGRYRLA